jgi:putative FmdB family regulatory protein
MPEYTYRCENCGIQFDIHQTFDDEPLTTCPECSEASLRKIYRPTRIVFKGKGFYATDHRSSSRTSYLNKGSEDSSSSEKQETKTESTVKESSSTSEKKDD